MAPGKELSSEERGGGYETQRNRNERGQHGRNRAKDPTSFRYLEEAEVWKNKKFMKNTKY